MLTLKVSGLVERPDDEWFHFGYAYFEPFLNAVRGLTLLAVTGYALVSAVIALLHGGREIVPGWALVYAAIAVNGCFLLAWIQRRAARANESPLLDVDAKGFRDTRLRLAAAGRYFYLLNHIRLGSTFHIRRVGELDAIRADIHAALEDLHPRLLIDTLFTEDERWMG